MKIPKAQEVPINELSTDGKNPNSMTEAQMNALKKNISKYGFLVPIITNKDGVLADGEHRLQAAKALNMKQVPVIRLDVDEVDRRMLRQIMNKLKGEHDVILDRGEYAFIYEQGRLDEFAGLLAKREKDFSRLLRAKDKEAVEDEVPEDVPTVCSPGDLWLLGDHKLLCGDATNSSDVDRLMGGEKADMVFTDPPYGIDYQDTKGKHNKISGDKGLEGVKELLKTTLKLDSPLFICCNWKCYSTFEESMRIHNKHPKACIVWDKGSRIQNLDKFGKQHEFILYHGPFGGEKTVDVDVWQVSRETRSDHPTAKPVALIERAINHFPRGNVIDLFGGSGSTLIACEKTGRKCLMMELDPHYCDIIIKRWEEYTGKKAKKE